MSVSGLLRRWAIKVLALLLMGGLSACDDELTGLDGFGGDTDYEAAEAYRFVAAADTGAALSLEGVTGSIATTDLTLAEASVGTRQVTGILGSGNGRISLEVTTGMIGVDGF